MPYNIAGKKSVQVQVENMVARSTPVMMAVQDAAPALFTANSSGKGMLAALNQDATVNSVSNPAAKGSIVVLYAAGAGSMDPPLPDGTLVLTQPLSRPTLPVTVMIGGQAAEIVYAGAAPQFVSGGLQVNARVPDGIESGAVPVVLSVGSFSSPAGTTISVQ